MMLNLLVSGLLQFPSQWLAIDPFKRLSKVWHYICLSVRSLVKSSILSVHETVKKLNDASLLMVKKLESDDGVV
jgi:hypothetical protein